MCGKRCAIIEDLRGMGNLRVLQKTIAIFIIIFKMKDLCYFYTKNIFNIK